MKIKIRGTLAVVIVIAIIIFYFNSNSCKNIPVEELGITGHTSSLALHYHVDLKIIIDGEEFFIPSDIGVEKNLMRAVHTHDSSGHVHIEGPCKRDFILGDFFKIWQKNFDSQCIFNSCVDKGELKMSVNGVENKEFNNLVLKDKQEILVEYIGNK